MPKELDNSEWMRKIKGDLSSIRLGQLHYLKVLRKCSYGKIFEKD